MASWRDIGYQRATPALLATSIVALWALQHPYAGIHHDGQLYTIQALARVNPGLSTDVFLRYGSQDSFTCFGSLYGAAIATLGVAGAAALLTLLSHVAFALAVLLLARCVLPGARAWIGAGLLCVIPLTYGANKVFYVMEDFVTPRLLAESLVLAGLAALLTRRYKLAVVAGVAAALLHPVMALTGFAIAPFVDTVHRRWRWRLLAVGGTLGFALAGLMLARGLPLRFDEAWWPLVHDGLPYLFPLEWHKFDWARVVVLVTFLYAGARRLPAGALRTLCRAALGITAAALLLNIVGGDLLHLVLVTQLQFWRVLWLATALAVLAAPLVVPLLWNGGQASRIALLAIFCAFLLADERFALSSALVAAVALLIADRVRPESPALRAISWGACALLALSLVINLASSAIVARTGLDQEGVPQWMQALRGVSGTGALPAVALCAIGWVATRAAPAALAVGTAVSLALAVWFCSIASYPWIQSPLSTTTRAAFASWREHIPTDAEVLWFTSPLAAWVLLERPSYVSVQQTASSLFSREAAMVLQARMAAMPEFLRAADPKPWQPTTGEERGGEGSLQQACGATSARFIVTRQDLGKAPLAVADATLPAAWRGWKLFDCDGGGTK